MIRDVARLVDHDDLLLFVAGWRPLQIATGANRARVCPTRRRFVRAQFQTGPLLDRLRRRLLGARLRGFEQPVGERRLTILLRKEAVDLRLEVELFGNRGLWCLTDAAGRISELSRVSKTGRRSLRPGEPYQPPPGGARAAEEPERFAPPCLAAVDEHFTALDLEQEEQRLRLELSRVLERSRRQLQRRIAGLAEQQRQAERAPELRLRADMLLAYGFAAGRGARSLTVPHPEEPDRQWQIPLAPDKPIQDQADALYRRARKLEQAGPRAKERQAAAKQELAELETLDPMDTAHGHDALLALRDELRDRGLVQRPPSPPTVEKARLKKALRGESFRVFRSIDGYTILVGRDNRQNDKLSIAVARGNDLWLHVGGGHAGSHVVVRVPKGKTASLDTLLDAGTLAVHFSKARGASRCDVTYTHAKNVRKSKGLAPGRVTVAHARTLVVDADAARLERILDTLQSE